MENFTTEEKDLLKEALRGRKITAHYLLFKNYPKEYEQSIEKIDKLGEKIGFTKEELEVTIEND